MEIEGTSDVIIPSNVAIRIFSFVSRDDLENCRLTCKTWKNVIDYADSLKHSELPFRPIDAIILSTNSEFSAKIYYRQTVREYYYRKYFADRDIDEIEVERVRGLPSSFDEQKFTFPCGERLLVRTSRSLTFPPIDSFHHHRCKRIKPAVYRENGNYTRKLFTPPLSFYERLQRMLKKCRVRRVIFHAFTFTDFFVEKLHEYVPEAFANVDLFVMHCCNLRCVSVHSFHELLGSVCARRFFMDRLRNCVPNHFSAPLLQKASIQKACIFYVGFCTGRRTHHPVTCPIDDETIINYMKMLGGEVRRIFFGIALCQITPQFSRIYEKLITSRKERRLNAYSHLLFGDIRFLSDDFVGLSG